MKKLLYLLLIVMTKNINAQSEVNDIILGGYTSSKIEEYSFDTSTNEFTLENTKSTISQLYFESTRYFFKRGDNDWKMNYFKYFGFKEDAERYYEVGYLFGDDHEQLVVLSKDKSNLTWYKVENMEKIVGKIVYHNLKKDNSVSPTN